MSTFQKSRAVMRTQMNECESVTTSESLWETFVFSKHLDGTKVERGFLRTRMEG